ncbi:DUF1015 domain-containing protein [Candidatus Saganbacteria bacterium]|nr:DUF1015 domain-containing protein [Candidatus Saganbacteria bacterium]
MAKLFPFKGILYNKKKLKNLAKVMSPPYDVISPDLRDELYKKSEFNIIRLILGKEFPGDSEYNNKYVRAATTLSGWLRHEILIQDPKPAIYVYEQVFTVKRQKLRRLGFISLLRLEDMGRGKVFPHEETLSKPKLDRIELIRATAANLDCVFAMFSDEKLKVLKVLKQATKRKPTIELKDHENTVNRLWRVDQRSAIGKIVKEMKDKPVFIADGHHRYEAALRNKAEMKEKNTRFTEEESYNHIMMYFTPVENPGLVVLPIHRLIRTLPFLDVARLEEELKNYFEVTEYPFGPRTLNKQKAKLLRELEKRAGRHAFGMIVKEVGKLYLLTLRNVEAVDVLVEEEKPEAWKRLDVTILRALVLERILNVPNEEYLAFTKDADEAIDKVKNGEFQIAFLLNPTQVSDILTIAGKFEKMPQKSTYFYPKLLTGLVINRIVHGEKVV